MRKTVLVLASGVLPELNNVSGPITHPTRIDIKNLKMLVKNNRNVQECDPEDPWNESKRVPLTMDNLITDNFTNRLIVDDPLLVFSLFRLFFNKFLQEIICGFLPTHFSLLL